MAANGTRSRRGQIQDAAEQLFREKGYLATSMRDIADAMKMRGGGSLYAHIEGKEDLLWDIANEATDAFFGAIEPIMAIELSPAEKLREAMIAHMLAITTHLGAAAVYFDEWRHLKEPRRSEFLERRDAYEGVFQQLIRDGVKASMFGPLDERLATIYILGAMNAIRHWFKPNGRLSEKDVAASIAEMTLKGLCTFGK
jgi:TetR/AcrR family transcriptional regulator, cholesterol catabolism regulator